MTEQLYLLRISAMNTSDDCDIVPSAEIIVDRDMSTEHLPLFESLAALIRKLSDVLKDAPVSGVRPMTRDEIRVWRDDEAAS